MVVSWMMILSAVSGGMKTCVGRHAANQLSLVASAVSYCACNSKLHDQVSTQNEYCSYQSRCGLCKVRASDCTTELCHSNIILVCFDILFHSMHMLNNILDPSSRIVSTSIFAAELHYRKVYWQIMSSCSGLHSSL